MSGENEATSAAPVELSKVLVVCGVAGQYEKVFKRVQQLHTSAAGPFDLLLCVGDFFAAPRGDQLADESKAVAQHQLSEYIEGFRSVPLPTYFIAGPHEDKYLPGTREQLAPNLFYLGRFGIARLRGLRIAYVSGQFACADADRSSFLRTDFESLVSTWASDVRRGVDILLTNEWPRHLLVGVPPDALPPNVAANADLGVDGVATVARTLKPRYHFAATGAADEPLFYLRPPYEANRASINDFGRTHVTRFVSLAPVDNPAKQKFVYAVNVTPIDDMTDAAINERPPNTTNSPFVLADANAAATVATTAPVAATTTPAVAAVGGLQAPSMSFVKSGTQQQQQHSGAKRSLSTPGSEPNPIVAGRWSQDVQWQAGGGTSRRGGRGGGGGDRHANKRARVMQPTRPCWFCLKSPDVEKHLIVSVSNETYVALAKGGLVDDHLLIVAVEHVQSIGDMSDAGRRECARYKQSIASYFRLQEREPLFFERFVVFKNEVHMHVQAVPLPRDSAATARDAFLAGARERNVTLIADTTPDTIGGLLSAPRVC
jgi:diadenosine tetraphosphate (Ap4A) HIT family hydrolase